MRVSAEKKLDQCREARIIEDTHSGVSADSNFRRKAKNRIAFNPAEETSGTEPDDTNRPKKLPTSVESIGGGTNARFSRVVGCGCGSSCGRGRSSSLTTDRLGDFTVPDADGTNAYAKGTAATAAANWSFLLCFMVHRKMLEERTRSTQGGDETEVHLNFFFLFHGC